MAKVDYLTARKLIKDGATITKYNGATGEDNHIHSYYIRDGVLYYDYLRQGPTCVVGKSHRTYEKEEDIERRINESLFKPKDEEEQLVYSVRWENVPNPNK